MSMTPVTPQRLSRTSLNATPYTPLSLRSFTSTSSTLTTPGSISQAGSSRKRLSFPSVSPDVGITQARRERRNSSLADIADNWRAKANEDRIGVASAKSFAEDSHFGDDEASDAFSDSGFITTEEALLPPPFLSTHRRPRAHSHAPLPTAKSFSASTTGPFTSSTSPNILRTPAHSLRLANLLPSSMSKVNFNNNINTFSGTVYNNHSQNVNEHSNEIDNVCHGLPNSGHAGNSPLMCTPPPNRVREKQLKMKGSFTDPAVVRHRPGFAVVSTPARDQRAELGSQSLFDIHENDYEREYEEYSDVHPQQSYDFGYDEDRESRHEDASRGVGSSFAQPPNACDHEEPSVGGYSPLMGLVPNFMPVGGYPFMNMNRGPNLGMNNPFSGYNPQAPSIPMPQLPSLYQHPLLFAQGRNLLGDGGSLGAPGYVCPEVGPGSLGGNMNSMLQGVAANMGSEGRLHEQLRWANANATDPTSQRHKGKGHDFKLSSNGYSSSRSSVSPGLDAARPSSRSDDQSRHDSLFNPSQCSVCFRSAYPPSDGPTRSTCASPVLNSSANIQYQPSRPTTSSLAILSPCGHPLCSACLTSALNIVGEKDMECAVCKKGVTSFRLVNLPAEMGTITGEQTATTVKNTSTTIKKENILVKSSSKMAGKGTDMTSGKRALGEVDMNRLRQDQPLHSTPRKPRASGKDVDGYARGQSFFDPLFSSPGSVGSGFMPNGMALDCAFEINLAKDGNGLDGVFGGIGSGLEFDLTGVRASTPKVDPEADRKDQIIKDIRNTKGGRKGKESVVLRIDNVPWDITPPMIAKWLEQPVERVHVLLDRKGKTISHAFVEVAEEDTARAVLRGESQKGTGKMRTGVLGKGRRARGVTVTRSGQEELMRALFPSWRGSFDGSRPSLAGLTNAHIISTLESGLMTEAEIAALLGLIKAPDSHFLKVPSLPFYSLVSILSKFPAEVDSRVFWSRTLQNMLFDLTSAAVQVLLNRAKDQGDTGGVHVSLAKQIVDTAAGCQAFTSEQVNKLTGSLGQSQSSAEHIEASSTTFDEFTKDTAERVSTPTLPADPEMDRALTIPLPPSPLRGTKLETKPVDSKLEVTVQAESNEDPNLDALAREFGVEAQLVAALVQRLAGKH